MDLNLLVALDALVEHESVQGAAAALHLTPPAMSHALRRLREATGDDVLVRSGRRMVVTPRAAQLRDEVRDVLVRAGALLTRPGELRLDELRRTFTVRGNDALVVAVAPALLEDLSASAPGVTIAFLGEQPVDGQDLARGAVDIELGGTVPGAPAIRSRTIGADRLEVLLRAGHPLAARQDLDVESFAAAEHVVVSRRGRLRGPVDDALDALGLRRRVLASVPSTGVALEVVRRSDAITLAARRLVPVDEGIVVRPVPVALDPVPAVVSWHRRHDSDPAHRWLRERIGDLLAGLLA